MNRRSWAALAVSLTVLLMSALFHGLHSLGPSDGTRVPPEPQAWTGQGLRVMSVVDRPGGLRDGDVVVAVGGVPLVDWAQRLTALNRPWRRFTPGDQVEYIVLRGGSRQSVAVTLGAYPWGALLRQEWKALFAEGVFLALAAFVFIRRPREEGAQALLLAASGILGSSSWSLGLQVLDLIAGWEYWLYLATTTGGYVLLWIALLHFMVVFPSQHPILRGRPWLIPVSYALPYGIIAVSLLSAWRSGVGEMGWLSRVGRVVSYLELTYLTLAVVAAITNYRSAKDPKSRRKTRWVFVAFLITSVLALAFGMIPSVVIGRPLIWWNDLALAGLLMPVSMAVAILRHKLFDIDRVFNRALVYSALTFLVVTLYVVLVGGVGTLLGSQGDVLLSLGATAVVALLFDPVRRRLQTAVNRMMYGDRDDPYNVLTRLGKDLGSTLSPASVLPTVSHTIADALKLPYVGIYLRSADGYREASSYGLPSGELLKLPLKYQQEQIGHLAVAHRSGDDHFTAEERNLLEDVSQQAGIAAHAVLLTDELQRSRERLVLAREEERRRLRRDLHDRLGAGLASLALKLEAASELVEGQPDRARRMLGDLQLEAGDAIVEVRRLVHDLRPPALDELGLVAALESRAAQLARAADDLVIRVQAPEPGLPALPAAVEAAAYRICVEAMTNVVRHAGARRCRVALGHGGRNGGELRLRVEDNGKGMQNGVETGVGMMSMRERAEELGGSLRVRSRPDEGTEVIARLPLRPSPQPEGARR